MESSSSEELNHNRRSSTTPAAPICPSCLFRGTVIGDGKLKNKIWYSSPSWTKSLLLGLLIQADHYHVASDSVAKDELRKELIKQALNELSSTNVVPNSEIDRRCRSRFGGSHCFDAIWSTSRRSSCHQKGGVPIKTNVGSIGAQL